MIGFAGLSHLGIVSSVAAAAQGNEVVGFDTDTATVAALSAGLLPVHEPQLDDLFAEQAEHLTFSADARVLQDCSLIFLSQDVPTDDRGESSLEALTELLESIRPHIAPQTIVIVLCQVPPGFTRELAEQMVGKTEPSQRLYYQVETLIFGRAVERALKPERFIVGCAHPDEPLAEDYAEYLHSFGCPILPMRYESAELAKISINACLVASVTTANTLADLCERIGADWGEIVPALRLDARIGPQAYLAPGLGIAGGNLERERISVEANGRGVSKALERAAKESMGLLR